MLRLTAKADDSFRLRTARKPWRCYTVVRGGVEVRPWDHGALPAGHGPIPVGARHVEYLGETAAFQSGDRYCLACATAAGLVEDAPA